MAAKTIHCPECVEDIPSDEMTWEDNRLYCGRCGAELEPTPADRDLLDEITSGRPPRLFTLDDDLDDDEDLDEDDLDEDEDDDDAWEDEEDE